MLTSGLFVFWGVFSARVMDKSYFGVEKQRQDISCSVLGRLLCAVCRELFILGFHPPEGSFLLRGPGNICSRVLVSSSGQLDLVTRYYVCTVAGSSLSARKGRIPYSRIVLHGGSLNRVYAYSCRVRCVPALAEGGSYNGKKSVWSWIGCISQNILQHGRC